MQWTNVRAAPDWTSGRVDVDGVVSGLAKKGEEVVSTVKNETRRSDQQPAEQHSAAQDESRPKAPVVI